MLKFKNGTGQESKMRANLTDRGPNLDVPIVGGGFVSNDQFSIVTRLDVIRSGRSAHIAGPSEGKNLRGTCDVR